jgi:tRNA dimethylallyltransferase
MTEKRKIVVILGPTATGKSKCGILLAQKIGGEIISGDSMLVYKDMNIATAKPTSEELAMVPHHLIDILLPTASFNVVDFKTKAAALIEEISGRGKVPIIVGGTGLYLKALLENYQFAQTEAQKELRASLEALAKKEGREALYARLTQLDPEGAKELKVNDNRRLIRAIEVATEGERVSTAKSTELAYDATVFGLNMERPVLYERINARVDEMVQAGVIEETKKLVAAGVPAYAQSMTSIGYRQILKYLAGDYDKEECINKIKQATRNFAKRQITWYKQMPYIKWFMITPSEDYDKLVNKMVSYLN